MFKKDAIKNPDQFFQDRFADYRMKKDGSDKPRSPGSIKPPKGPKDKPLMGKPKARIDERSSAVQMFSREKVGELVKPLAGCDEPDFTPKRTEAEDQEIEFMKKERAAKRAQMRKVAEGLGK